MEGIKIMVKSIIVPTPTKKQSSIEKKLADLRLRETTLLKAHEDELKKANQALREARMKQVKKWGSEVCRAINDFYPIPASEIKERLQASLSESPTVRQDCQDESKALNTQSTDADLLQTSENDEVKNRGKQ